MHCHVMLCPVLSWHIMSAAVSVSVSVSVFVSVSVCLCVCDEP